MILTSNWNVLRLSVILSLMCICDHSLHAQNLAPNPDFEFNLNCPSNIGTGFLLCDPWENGNNGTADYFNACNNPGVVGVPMNNFGFQNGHSGVAYCGIYLRTQVDNDYREYLHAPLVEPLVNGSTYHVRFYVSLAEGACPTGRIGAYFSTSPSDPGHPNIIDVTPQIDHVLGFLSNTSDWMEINGCFVAQGGERYITIGNFHSSAETPYDESCSGTLYSYYYIDDVEVMEGPPPGIIQLDLSGPLVSCDSLVLSPGINNVGYQWEDGSTDDFFIIDTSGTYSLTVTDGCAKGIDSITVLINGVMEDVQLNADSVYLCTGDVYEIMLDPAYTYSWSHGETTAHIILTSSGLYTVTMDDGCDVSTDSIRVFQLFPPPSFDLGPDTIICATDTLTFSFNPAWGTYLWQDGSDTTTYHISNPGTYHLEIVNTCGSSTDEITISTHAPQTLDLDGPVVRLCNGDSLVIQLDTILGSILWQDGSSNSSYTITQSGTYSVQVQQDCGTLSDTLLVEYSSPPIIQLGEDMTICPAQLPLTLDASNAINATQWLWQDGSNLPIYNVTQPGIFNVTVTNDCGEDRDTIEVIETNLDPVVILPDDFSMCAGDTVVLDPSGDEGMYVWQDQSTDTTLLILTGGMYHVAVSNVCGIGYDTIQIAEMLAPLKPNLGEDIDSCVGSIIILQAPPGAHSMTWSDGSQMATYMTSSSEIVILNLANACGESNDTITILLEDTAPTTLLPVDTAVCEGDVLSIALADDNVLTTLWEDGSTDPLRVIDIPGLYIASQTNRCGADVDSIIVTHFYPPESFDLGPDTFICEGGSIVMVAPATPYHIRWQDDSDQPTLEIVEAGMYSLEISNACGIETDTIIVHVDDHLPDIAPETVLYFCPGDEIELHMGQGFEAQYAWNTSEIDSSILISQTGTYSVTISTKCLEVAGEIKVILSDSCQKASNIFVPNIFSPNHDGINDAFQISISADMEITEMLMTIYDRWGNLLYTTEKIPSSWDGTKSDYPLNPGVYVYAIRYSYLDVDKTRKITLTGEVTLVR